MHRANPIRASRTRTTTAKVPLSIVLDQQQQEQQHHCPEHDLDELTQRLLSWQSPSPKPDVTTTTTATTTTTVTATGEQKKRKLGSKLLLLSKQDSVKTMDDLNRILEALTLQQPANTTKVEQQREQYPTNELEEWSISSGDWSWDSSEDSGDACSVVTIEHDCFDHDDDDFSAFTLHATASVASSCNSSVTWHGGDRERMLNDGLDEILAWEIP